MAVVSIVALAWTIACAALFEQIIRPMQTLANVVAALREDDFSFRARGARRGDAIGELALEINSLAATLQHQRTSSVEALSLLERVMNSMPSAVLAFDDRGHLRLINPAAERSFSLDRLRHLGEPAAQLSFLDLLAVPDEGAYPPEIATQPNSIRWSVRRSTFRLNGVAHTLFVLTDIGAALRAEERSAWQRLIRVLGHEINNSLTPIKSIAGSLRTRLQRSEASEHATDLDRGLSVIEDRAASLNRFLQAYQRLTRLPPPRLQPTQIETMLVRAASLETRVTVTIVPGPSLSILVDPDQIQQLFINLIQNAADAVLSEGCTPPDDSVVLTWALARGEAVIAVHDRGPGLSNPANLFVPFYTTKLAGTGIGLVIARSIAVSHRGGIALTNRVDGQGCTAEVNLPIA